MLDPISDMLTRIRNAQRARKYSVIMSTSKIKKAVAQVLFERGFIESLEEKEEDGKKYLEITLKYHKQGFSEKMGAIHEIRRVSKEGQRVYVSAQDIRKVKNGLGVAVISTSQGVLSGERARKLGIGGEYICSVW